MPGLNRRAVKPSAFSNRYLPLILNLQCPKRQPSSDTFDRELSSFWIGGPSFCSFFYFIFVHNWP